MSIKETVGRYEGPVRTSTLQRVLQMKRISDDEALAQKLGLADKEWDVNEKAKWAERLEEKVGYHRARAAAGQCDAEVRQGAKAAIMVRRRALELQIQAEMAQFNKELAADGKTFHTQRI